VDDSFVTLAALLREAPGAQAAAPFEPALEPASPVACFPHAAIVQELALLRLAAGEAFERGTAQLLRAFAQDVLARELCSSPADVQALAARLLAGSAAYEPVELVLSPDDAARVRVPLPVRADPELAPGDLIVRVRDGALESHLTFRLTAALARAQNGGAP
jgi:flagellar biosynthesis/type III secretory pathway protein FliH